MAALPCPFAGRPSRAGAALSAALVALACGARALAAPAPALDDDLRAAALEAALAGEQRRYQVWRWSWTAAYGALSLGSLALVPRTPRPERVDLYSGAVSSAIAIAPLLFLPQPTRAAGPACAPGGGRLGCAEATVAEVAGFQRQGRGLVAQAINLAYNALWGAFLGFGFGRWRSAAFTFGSGMLVGELQIFTQPQGAIRLQRAPGGRP